MRAIDIGTTRVVQLPESASTREAARTMLKHDVGCVVVVSSDLNAAGGIVTDRDLTLRLVEGGGEISLHDVASVPLIHCRPEATIDELVATRHGAHVRRLPIVDERGTLMGIVSVDDVIAVLSELMQRVANTLTSTRSIE
jgi:CBS domain-containing protein